LAFLIAQSQIKFNFILKRPKPIKIKIYTSTFAPQFFVNLTPFLHKKGD